MNIRRSIAIMFVTCLLGTFALARNTSRHFKAVDCGYEFDYPAEWTVESLPPDKYTSCAVRIRPNDFTKRIAKNDVDIYTVTVSVPGGGTFLDAASRNGFDFYKGEWVTVGRQGSRGEASVINTPEWSGLRGTADVGCHHEHGGYAGLCEFERLVVQNSAGNIWDMEGGPKTSETLKMVLSTFRFERKQ